MREFFEQGLVRNRDDVLTALREAGLEINRAGRHYITVKDPESGEKLRLKGGIYAEQWKFEFPGRENAGQDRERAAGDGSPDPETVRRFEQELERVVEKRARYNRGRYLQRDRGYGEEHHFPLPGPGRDVQREIPAVHNPERGHPAPDRADLLGTDYAVPAPNHGRAPRVDRTDTGKGSHTGAKRPDMGHVQGFGAVSRERQGLPADTGGQNTPLGRDGRQTGSLDNSEEIGHDRTGTHFERHPDHAGAGFDRHAENARHILGQSPAQPGEPRPGHPPATGENRATSDRAKGIGAALATLERYTRELGTALVALERLVERQIERFRERERQRSRGPGFGR